MLCIRHTYTVREIREHRWTGNRAGRTFVLELDEVRDKRGLHHFAPPQIIMLDDRPSIALKLDDQLVLTLAPVRAPA